MQELLKEMGPGMVALAICGFLALIAFWLRNSLVKTESRQEIAARHRKQVEQSATQRMSAVHQPMKRPVVDLEGVGAVIEDFAASALLEHARALFRAVQQSRVQPDRPRLEQDLLSGALDVALASGPGLEAVGELWVSPARFERLGGTVDGCEATIRLRGLVEETRNGAENLVEVEESWTFGWPPGRKTWKVMRVQRHWRRTLDAPRTNPEAQEPGPKAQAAANLDEAREGIDFEAVEAAAELVVPAWAEAESTDTPESLEGLVEPGFLEGVRGSVVLHQRFDLRRTRALRVETVTPVRVLRGPGTTWASVRVYGAEHLSLAPAEGGGTSESVDRPWAAYLTFAATPDGRWELAWAEDDDDWLV